MTYGLHVILRFELEAELICRPPRREGPALGLERQDEGPARRRPPDDARAASRTSTGRPASSAISRATP